MKFGAGVWLLLLAVQCWIASALAHEVRPAYLQLRQVDAETYDVLWKVPGMGEDRRLALFVEFAPPTEVVGEPSLTVTNSAFLQKWRVRRPGGLDGTSVHIAGQQSTLTDVLVRLERLDGTAQTLRVTPSAPDFVIQAQPHPWQVTKTYALLGIEHILMGIDHLLFVLALILLIEGAARLFWAITAFTAAHSITLAAATLGWVTVPPPPVEAVIALSIVFLASEIVHRRAGRAGLTSRKPWVVAFGFGLLHGLGFAGALSEVGLPANEIPRALLFFNVGVEIGQVLFIASVLALLAMLRRTRLRPPAWVAQVPVYAIGTVAAFWTIERVSAFVI